MNTDVAIRPIAIAALQDRMTVTVNLVRLYSIIAFPFIGAGGYAREDVLHSPRLNRKCRGVGGHFPSKLFKCEYVGFCEGHWKTALMTWRMQAQKPAHKSHINHSDSPLSTARPIKEKQKQLAQNQPKKSYITRISSLFYSGRIASVPIDP